MSDAWNQVPGRRAGERTVSRGIFLHGYSHRYVVSAGTHPKTYATRGGQRDQLTSRHAARLSLARPLFSLLSLSRFVSAASRQIDTHPCAFVRRILGARAPVNCAPHVRRLRLGGQRTPATSARGSRPAAATPFPLHFLAPAQDPVPLPGRAWRPVGIFNGRREETSERGDF